MGHEKGKSEGNKEEAIELNRHIDSISTKLKALQIQLENDEISYTAEELKDEFLGRGSSGKFLLEVVAEHNLEMQNEIGKENEFSLNTLKTWRSTHSHLRRFILEKYKSEDIQIRKIDVNFINEYRKFLRNNRNCIPISSDKYLKHLKKIILLALSRKWIIENPFLFVKLTARPSPREYLTSHELEAIRTKEFTIDKMVHVRDIFVFCCYTALSYTDVKKLHKDEIGIGEDGKKWIFIKRQKTDTPSRIPILNEALAILDIYRDHPSCAFRSLLLPVASNQRINKQLLKGDC